MAKISVGIPPSSFEDEETKGGTYRCSWDCGDLAHCWRPWSPRHRHIDSLQVNSCSRSWRHCTFSFCKIPNARISSYPRTSWSPICKYRCRTQLCQCRWSSQGKDSNRIRSCLQRRRTKRRRKRRWRKGRRIKATHWCKWIRFLLREACIPSRMCTCRIRQSWSRKSSFRIDSSCRYTRQCLRSSETASVFDSFRQPINLHRMALRCKTWFYFNFLINFLHLLTRFDNYWHLLHLSTF